MVLFWTNYTYHLELSSNKMEHHLTTVTLWGITLITCCLVDGLVYGHQLPGLLGHQTQIHWTLPYMGLFRTLSARWKTVMLAVEIPHKVCSGHGDSHLASKNTWTEVKHWVCIVPPGYTILHGVIYHKKLSLCKFSVLPNKKVCMVKAVNGFRLQ